MNLCHDVRHDAKCLLLKVMMICFNKHRFKTSLMTLNYTNKKCRIWFCFLSLYTYTKRMERKHFIYLNYQHFPDSFFSLLSTIKIYSNSLKYCLLDENLFFFPSPFKIHITWPTLLDVDYYFISENVENNVGRKLAESKVGTWNAVTTSFCYYLYLKYFCLRPWYHDNFMPKKFLCVF